MQGWIGHLQASSLSSSEKAVFAALAELSCSPWKFDLLWDARADFGYDTLRAGPLSDDIERLANPRLLAFATTVLDDLTIFTHLTGEAPDSARRGAFRTAYLSLRPVLCRTVLFSPPHQGMALESQEYVRLAFARACGSAQDLEGATQVLGEAARRCDRAGLHELASLCSMNARALRGHGVDLLPGGGSDVAAHKAFNLAFSVSDAALLREFILQWWPLFDANFRKRTLFWSGERQATRNFTDLKHIVSLLEPVATALAANPGAGAALAGFLATRDLSGYPLPDWLYLCPQAWLDRCRTLAAQFAPAMRGDTAPPETPFQHFIGAGVPASARPSGRI